MFTHWGHGLCSCRYRSYLSVMSRSLGMDRYSPSPHGYGNAIHGTKRVTHHLTVGKCFFVFQLSLFRFSLHGVGHDCQRLGFTALLSLTWWCVSIFQGLVNMQSQFHFTLVIFLSVVNTQMIKLTHTQRHMGLD